MKYIKTEIPGYYYVKNKKGNITYFYNYKDKTTKLSKRKKISTFPEHNTHNLKIAVNETLNILKDNLTDRIKNDKIKATDQVEYIDHFTLNEIIDIYKKRYYDKTVRKLKETIGNGMTDEEFNNNASIKKKLYSVEKFDLTYTKNVRNSSIGETRYKDLTKRKISIYIETELNQNLAKKTKYTLFAFLRAAINSMIRNDFIQRDNVFDKIKMERENRQRTRVLSEREIELLLTEAKKYNKERPQLMMENAKDGRKTYTRMLRPNYNIYTSIYLGIITAGRASTVLSIRKKDIDLENKIINLTNFKAGDRKYKIPLNDDSVKWFEKKLKFYDSNEYLIKPSNKHMEKRVGKNQPMRFIPREVYHLMDRLFNQGKNKQLNTDRDDVVNFHTLRRSIATNLVKKGVSIYNVKTLLDHTTIDITEKYLNINHLDYKDNLEQYQKELFKNFRAPEPTIEITNIKQKLIKSILSLKNLEDDKIMEMALMELTEKDLKLKLANLIV